MGDRSAGIALTFGRAARRSRIRRRRPEEALVRLALRRVHMLFFSRTPPRAASFIESLRKRGSGEMGKERERPDGHAQGAPASKITWVGAPPSAEQLDKLQCSRSHQRVLQSRISVTSEIVIEPH